jgi:hypothetical protein
MLQYILPLSYVVFSLSLSQLITVALSWKSNSGRPAVLGWSWHVDGTSISIVSVAGCDFPPLRPLFCCRWLPSPIFESAMGLFCMQARVLCQVTVHTLNTVIVNTHATEAMTQSRQTVVPGWAWTFRARRRVVIGTAISVFRAVSSNSRSIEFVRSGAVEII